MTERITSIEYQVFHEIVALQYRESGTLGKSSTMRKSAAGSNKRKE